jgi:acetyl esterase/lipase
VAGSNLEKPGDRLQISPDGTVAVPAFRLPPSAALSPESRARWAMMLNSPQRMEIPDAGAFDSDAEFRTAVDGFRAALDAGMGQPMVDRLLQSFPMQMAAERIAGVPVEVFTPRGWRDDGRVLVNLHGGAFFAGATHVARVESIPLAHMSGLRVISVDYRQGYEHRFPAASEDIAAVYQALLETHAPGAIGVYGASAGGVLALQATAWILRQGLPAPGAIGVLSAGTGGPGDGSYLAAIGTGTYPPDLALTSIAGAKVGYFADADPGDPMVNPNLAPLELRARFPPSLFITATRAFDFSPALGSHRALCQAGVDAQLHVFDGLGHSFFYDASTPEAVDAYQTMVRFFTGRLKA